MMTTRIPAWTKPRLVQQIWTPDVIIFSDGAQWDLASGGDLTDARIMVPIKADRYLTALNTMEDLERDLHEAGAPSPAQRVMIERGKELFGRCLEEYAAAQERLLDMDPATRTLDPDEVS